MIDIVAVIEINKLTLKIVFLTPFRYTESYYIFIIGT